MHLDEAPEERELDGSVDIHDCDLPLIVAGNDPGVGKNLLDGTSEKCSART